MVPEKFGTRADEDDVAMSIVVHGEQSQEIGSHGKTEIGAIGNCYVKAIKARNIRIERIFPDNSQLLGVNSCCFTRLNGVPQNYCCSFFISNVADRSMRNSCP